MSYEAYVSLLAAVVKDANRMRVYEAQLAIDAQAARLRAALGALSQTDAYRRARNAQTKAGLRAWLKFEIGRPTPPPHFVGEPEIWELVRNHLRQQLELIDGDSKRGV